MDTANIWCKGIRNTVLLALLVIGFSACGPNYVYENSLECDERGWAFQDSLQSSFEIGDSSTIYNLYLNLEHSPEFAFQNFYTRIHTYFPNGEKLTEQLSLELAAKGGIWLGDCNSKSCALSIPIQKDVFFNQVGQYKITIEQFSRQDPLPHIQSISFALEQTDKKK